MNSTFMYKDTKLPAFLQFPEFLLRFPISQTAKIIYLVLYDRSRLSIRNEWIDEFSRVFVVYPIAELSKRIGKSESTIKTGMKELCEAGLLIKRNGGFSKPNYLYVKYGSDSQISDTLEKKPFADAGISLPDGQDSDCDTGGFPSPNKVISHSNSNNSNGVMERKSRGRYENVFLTDAEIKELKCEFPDNAERYIEELSEYIASTGKNYVNFVAAVRRWAVNDHKNAQRMAFENYDSIEEESF